MGMTRKGSPVQILYGNKPDLAGELGVLVSWVKSVRHERLCIKS
jgi:hypothetical protein